MPIIVAAARRLAIAAATLVSCATMAQAGEGTAAMQAFLDGTIKPFAEAPVIIDAIKAQNAVTADYDQEKIDALDQAWRAEVGAADTPTISPVLDNAASDFLRSQVDAQKGRITEIFVMDDKGLNVASAGVTSDYWQGDEAKFTETFAMGPDAVQFGEIERDESTGTYQVQISFTLTDPASGEAIGAMTVGVDAEALE